jgi:5-methyltetrahydropteroyltriglutamate--homocysteine methyltransferase
MPRIGEGRALKWALERYWRGEINAVELEAAALNVRRRNWQTMAAAGVDVVPSNDFSLYDHVLDAAVMVGAVPARFHPGNGPITLDRYFAMARGADIEGQPVAPLDLTKWFDTNYHHLMPEIGPDTAFRVDGGKACRELLEATALGVPTCPVLLGPLSLLLRSVPTPANFDVMSALEPLVDIYAALLVELAQHGASWVRLDEPALVEDRSVDELTAFRRAYRRLAEQSNRPRLAVSTYFGHVGAALATLADLPIDGVGLDFCRGAENLDLLSEAGGLGTKVLFAGVVDGRNVWANDLDTSLTLLDRLTGLAGEVVISSSCSLLHVPLSLAAEAVFDEEIRPWLAFAEEKLAELAILARGADQGRVAVADAIEANQTALAARRCSPRVRIAAIRQRMAEAEVDPRRSLPLEERVEIQNARLRLPLLPTTTIGSFPQTAELRIARAAWRAGGTGGNEYRRSLESEIDRVVALQEDIGLDVLVHGEPERDDMVRHFAAQLNGFVLPNEGWVQSYGSRCVRPPVLFGDVERPAPMTLEWARYAQSQTTKPVKGMLTGPVTMLRWSFVRDDQPEADTTAQLGLAIRDELVDLQSEGIAVIQVDEPALREGLPLRHADRPDYLAWATRAFRLVTSAAHPDTQVHTHMCYAALGDIMGALEDLDIDVVSLEAARSHMGLVDELEHLSYRGGMGPGIYDVHSPNVPGVPELEALLRRALSVVGPDRLWVNPDCGLKTRGYDEVTAALGHMGAAAHQLRGNLGSGDAAQKATTGGSSKEM